MGGEEGANLLGDEGKGMGLLLRETKGRRQGTEKGGKGIYPRRPVSPGEWNEDYSRFAQFEERSAANSAL